MMKVEIRKIAIKDIDIVAKLLTNSFVEDKGVIVLFKENTPKYRYKVNHWFKETLKMLISNNQHINVAFEGDEIVGVSIVTHTSYQPSTFDLLKWTYSVLMTCGMTTVTQSAKHDKNRKNLFTDSNQYILEFIAVKENQRGKGIGKQLFSSLDNLATSKNASIWLETTKKHNIEIFHKMGYNLIDTKNECSVDYYIMVRGKVANKVVYEQ